MKLYYLEKKNIIIIIIILSISNKVSWRATKVYKPSHQYLPKCRGGDTASVQWSVPLDASHTRRGELQKTTDRLIDTNEPG